ncbi:MAG: ABC transporter permease [bacterium]|nr:ABC transporter permease [bacterium]
MKRKLQNITNKATYFIAIIAILLIWQMLCSFGVVPSFMLPSPVSVCQALVSEFSVLMGHVRVTLIEAMAGLAFGVVIGFVTAVLMDSYEVIYKAVYPLLVITQTIPTVAIAPLLVLWLGYEMTPKIVLIVIATFFPITIGVLDGLKSTDQDAIRLMKSMGATKFQVFTQLKFKSSLGSFFSSLKISVSYSIVGAVISEWLGGFEGLGVYMTRVKKSFAYDKMFAVIILISVLSILLMGVVKVLRIKCMPWEQK